LALRGWLASHQKPAHYVDLTTQVPPFRANTAARSICAALRKVLRMALSYLEGRHNQVDSSWTDERTAKLAQLWAKGLSAAQIVDYFNVGFTRNAVIGKAHRLNLPARRPGVTKGVSKPKLSPPEPRPPKLPAPPPLSPSPPAMRVLGLFDLESHHCRWPLGGLLEPPRLFCAADVGEDDNYCPYHRRMANPKEAR
jgi:GcrA cell cycle regulator